MSQRPASTSVHGLFLVPKVAKTVVAHRLKAKGSGPVLVTWTSEPGRSRKERGIALLTGLTAPLIWVAHALLTGHRG